jgi:Zn-dependent M16 (insulinase) family peptidase
MPGEYRFNLNPMQADWRSVVYSEIQGRENLQSSLMSLEMRRLLHPDLVFAARQAAG